MNKSFLEKIGILFASSMYIEWIIKDLIIFKKHPEFINEINKWIISEWLVDKRKKYLRDSFNQDTVDEFINLFDLDKSYKKLYTVIWLLRDIFWHSRIWIEEWKIWHCPKKDNKLKKIKELFEIEWDWDTISITNKELNFNLRLEMIEKLDKNDLPKIAKSIWLDYSKLR